MSEPTAAWMVLILAIVAALTTTRVSCEEVHQPRGRKLQLSPIAGFVGYEIGACLDLVVAIGGCVTDLLTSLTSLHIRLSPECCMAISGVDDSCLKPIFAILPFVLVPDFPSFLKSFCDAAPNMQTSLFEIAPTPAGQ